MTRYLKLLVIFLIMLLAGCGTQDGSSSDVVADDVTDDPVITEVAAVQVSASPRVIGFGETSEIEVRLYNDGGELIADTSTVTFSLDNRDLASIIPIASTSTGALTRTLTAGDTAGTVRVTATSGSISNYADIQIADPNQAVADTITVTANPTSLTVGGTAIVRAEVLDTSGDPMPDGTLVNFSVDNSGLGSIVTAATTLNGIAQATFSASLVNAGTVTVTAESGLAMPGTVAINVVAAVAGSIEFISAEPNVVVLQGAGGQETSVVQFLVKDVSGQPVAGSQEVEFSLSGPNGGESLTVSSASTVNGIVETILNSGTVPGTVTVIARVVDNPSLTTSSGVIAIGGGVPSAGHFSLSTSVLNLEGLAFDGVTADITARIADRYGNYNVLEGTSVSFSSECGAIDRSVSLSSTGAGTVEFRTQRPDPQDVDIYDASEPCDICEQYVNKRIETYETIFGTGIITNSNNPRDGLCTIIAEVGGEEEFTDANANGFYDIGETFEDTYDDTHLDKDDDNFDILPADEAAGQPYDPTYEDLIVDRNLDGVFDGMNGEWDANKRISSPIKLLMTGEPAITLSRTSMTVSDGGSQTIYYSVHDSNFNSPVAGTSVDLSVDVGSLSGSTSIDFLDSNIPGPVVYSVTIADSSPADDDPAEVGTLSITIDWLGNSYSYSIPVTVD